MKLQVTEISKNSLNKKEDKVQTVFSFSDGTTFGKLNFGTVFQAKILDDKSVDVSLIRKTGEETYEVYNNKKLFASKSVDFEDKSATTSITMNFKLIK